MDKAWWRTYINSVKDMAFDRVCCDRIDIQGVQHIEHPKFGNSGATAIALAKKLGAENIYLYGFDCQYTDGKRHWHDDHPTNLGNADSMPQWRRQFNNAAKHVSDINVVNCSRVSSLTNWPREKLENIVEN